jgi:hypothetical protein
MARAATAAAARFFVMILTSMTPLEILAGLFAGVPRDCRRPDSQLELLQGPFLS